MGNTRSGSTYFIDTSGVTLDITNATVVGIILTASNATNSLVLADNISGASYPNKLSLSGISGQSIYFDLSGSPITFTNGIRVKTVTSITATLILG